MNNEDNLLGHPSRRTFLATGTAAAAALASGAFVRDSLGQNPEVVFDEFAPPAYIDDFLTHDRPPAEGAAFRELWSRGIIDSWTNIGITGDPWQNKYDHQRWAYFNPLGKVIPPPKDTATVTPLWIAFPHRVSHYAGQAGYNKEQIYHFGDYGKLADGTPLPCIPPQYPCNNLKAEPAKKDGSCNNMSLNPWSPAGPRGWLDEYCEWSVKRRGDTIVAINFTCENPEYWNSVWTIDPHLVREIIEELVNWGKNKYGNKPKKVLVDDLFLRDADGKVIEDPQTGYAAYDTLNKWNRGTHTLPNSGGAIHLTSPPNTLGAEIYLAAAATILRTHEKQPVATSKDPQPVLPARDVICSGEYGGLDRDSDPHIGHSVNQAVRELGTEFMVTLANPVGLYIHQPEFSRFELPPNARGITIEDCWNLIRGKPGMGLHVVFQVPVGQNFTINDIKVDGVPIRYAGQIAETFKIGLTARAWNNDYTWPPMGPWPPGPQYPAEPEPSKDYPSVTVGKIPKEQIQPQGVQPLLGRQMFMAQSSIRAQLAFSTPRFAQGSKNVRGYVVPAAGAVKGATVAAVEGSGVDIKAVGYIPERDDAGQPPALEVTFSITDDAPLGLVGLIINNPGGKNQTPIPSMLEVVAE